MTGGDAQTHLLYGLRVTSELPLHQYRPVDGAPDVTITCAASIPEQSDPPPGRVLAHFETDRAHYTFTTDDSGEFVLRFYRTCDFVLDPSLSRVRVHVVDGADPGVAAILAAGAVLSFLLTMRGELVLHASAVEVGAAAVAFVGRSGMGKSTMGALLCAAGGRLVTDDVLRLDADGDGMRCRLGATELRLRKAAGELAGQFATPPPSRVTSDARDALRVAESVYDGVRLGAVVVPLPDRERTTAEITRLRHMDALITLLRFPRLLGWTDAVILDRQLQQAGDLVERVPVYLARVPWGPPFAPDIATTILTHLSLTPRWAAATS